jgi:Acyclic terpene utilisation family protein AtuA
MRIAIVSGDDILTLLQQNSDHPLFKNLETGEPLPSILTSLVTSNAYLGALPIVEALQKSADIVITGRVADPSLTVAPCIAHFGWRLDDYDRLAGATIAGHLIECGTQVTGGISTHWLDIPDPANIGFPVAEIYEDGSCVITKPSNTGGIVNTNVIKEQLLYEIGDPDQYLSPDATVSFLSLEVKQQSENRVLVTGAKGRPPPPTYKVSATYRDGFKIEAFLTIFGASAEIKARRSGEILLQRMRAAGQSFKDARIECLGAGSVVPEISNTPEMVNECVLRIALKNDRPESLEWFSKEVASLVTSGPQGLTGYTSGRPRVRPVFGYWPCLIERERVKPLVEILETK